MGGGVERGNGHHVGTGEKVPVTPDPERRSKDGNPLTNADGEVGVVVGVGMEWLLCRCLDAGPRRVGVKGKPVVDLCVWGAVPLCCPSPSGGAGKVPHTAFRDGVGNGQKGTVNGVAASFSGDEYQWAL